MNELVRRYPIRAVAKRTGLSTHVIRSWERRHSVPIPERTSTNRRLYSEADIEHLCLLRRAIQAGHSIGMVAGLSPLELREMLDKPGLAPMSGPFEAPKSAAFAAPGVNDFLGRCKAAIERLDRETLEDVVGEASTRYTMPVFLSALIGPLMDYVGELWREGEIRVTHEHMATEVVRRFLAVRRSVIQTHRGGSPIVVTTPSGQMHEIGALMVSLLAASDGWRDVYLGPNLPADDIVAAVRDTEARAVALSLVYPGDDPRVESELMFVRRHLPTSVAVFAGGRAAASYAAILNRLGIPVFSDLLAFRKALKRLRDAGT